MRNRLIPACLLVCLFLAPAACRRAQESPDGRSRLRIAVIPKSTTQEFWKGVHGGAMRAGRELDIDILWQGPIREDDREEQIRLVDHARTRGVSGIVLAPLDNKALRRPVSDATRAGIPVVIFDSGLDSDEYISLIETDNYKGGRMAGDHLATLLGGKGPVVMLRLQEGSASTTAREQGFLDAVAQHPGITVISSNQYAGPTSESAYRASENLLAAFRAGTGGIAGIFCPNESTTFGMLRALQSANLAGRIRLVGFDSSDKVLQGMRDGQVHALVLQNPVAMGYLGVKTMVAHLRGEKIERKVDTGATLVTAQNVDQPDLRERLHPGQALEAR